jgi:hypothetical protein
VILELGLGLDGGDLGFPPHSQSSHPRYNPGLRHHYNLRHHRTPIEFVGDGGNILALELGLDSGDLGFPPHSQPSCLRYDPNPVYATITIYAVIEPRSSPWETAAAS